MKFISRYVKEFKRYSRNELAEMFDLSDLEAGKFIKNLKAYGILKSVKNDGMDLSELTDDDIIIADESADSDKCRYVFKYVGIIAYGSRIIKVYPKYLNNDAPEKEMKQIIKVLEKYDRSSEQIIKASNANTESYAFNLLAIILWLMNDYYEYGTYSNDEEIIGINGDGEILWEKTIDESFALIKDNCPYYTELYIRNSVEDNFDYIKRLHECVLTECSELLQESKLDTIFDMEHIYLSDENLSDFGDKDYILYRLSSELNTQFNTRRQILLKTLYAYISADNKLFEDESGIGLYGTTAFHAVWEKVCADVLDNKIGTSELPFEIDKPEWLINGHGRYKTDTLFPDIISIFNIDEEKYFIIFDAKYYCIYFKDNNLFGCPGVADITKQYFYRLAYKEFCDKSNINVIKNCFILPCDDSLKNGYIETGTVEMAMLKKLQLENILVRQISAELVYEHYLRGIKLSKSFITEMVSEK